MFHKKEKKNLGRLYSKPHLIRKKEERMDKRIEKVIFKGLILVINKACIGYAQTELNILLFYNSLIFEFVDGWRQVSGAVPAVVHDTVILRNQVHVMENEARVVVEFYGLGVSNVHQHRPVKLSAIFLKDE